MLVRSLSVSVLWFLLLAMQVASGESPPRTNMKLWPEGAPDSPAGSQQDGDTPELILTLAASSQPTAAVVILPGGGYQNHAMDHEGYQFADWFQSMGITSAICTYRHRGKGNEGKGYGHPMPMMDAQRAVQTLRARCEEWNIDPKRIGVIGFSAGGHLASTISTHFAQPDLTSNDPIAHAASRPDFAILCYPVPADNSLLYYQACLKHGVPAELHVFPEGRHGLGLAREQPGASQWPALCQDWLRRIGVAAN